MELGAEKQKQEGHTWERSVDYATYASILGHYQVEAVFEHASGESLLDLACGDGLLTGQLARRFRRVVGVDASSVHLEKARARHPELTFHESLIETLDLAERFDTITMLNVLEHLDSPEDALRGAARMLAPGGRFIIHVPNAIAINRRISVIMGSLESCEELSPFDIHVAGHRRSYRLDTLVADVERAGLEVLATGGVFYKMLSMAQMDWLLAKGPWAEGGFGWGRVGAETSRDWRAEFCRACYEIGKEHPEDCNVIYVVATLR